MKKVCFLCLLFAGFHLFSQDNTSADKIKTSASINDFINDKSLISFKVVSYNIFYQPKIGEAELVKNNGPVFSADAKKLIQKAKSGDIYYFEEIKVLGPDNITTKIPGIAFKIE